LLDGSLHASSITRLNARRIASRTARLKAQRIASFVAYLKAPVGALLIALCVAQDKGHDIASDLAAAGFAVVTVSRGVCARTRR
jgi:hypothetical protein